MEERVVNQLPKVQGDTGDKIRIQERKLDLKQLEITIIAQIKNRKTIKNELKPVYLKRSIKSVNC